MKNKIAVILFLLIAEFSFSYLFVPYQGATKKIVTEHFVILFPEKYSEKALKVAVYSESIHAKLKDFMKWEPVLRTVLVMTDHTDSPNGAAVPLIRNTVYLYLSPLDLIDYMKEYDDPLYSLIVHEYTHILHLDQIRDGAWLWRAWFGKLYSPVSGSFRWYVEGFAVMSETKFSKGGRLDSAYNSAIIEAAARAKKIPSYDELMMPVIDWPQGDAVYHYGAKFLEYLYLTYGEEKYRTFFIDLSNDFWPFIYQFVFKFKKIYGKPLRELWKEWKSYEENKASTAAVEPKSASQLTALNGHLFSFVRGENYTLFSSSSYKYDQYLYKLYDDGKSEKVRYGNFKSITFTDDEHCILYTSMVPYMGGYYYSDVFSLDLKTKVIKKLTSRKRINYISFPKKNNTGVMVSNKGNRAFIYSAEYSAGKLRNIREINLSKEFIYIDQPDISENGETVFFSARDMKNAYGIYKLDLKNNELVFIYAVTARNIKQVNEKEITFIAKENPRDNLFIFSLETKQAKKVLKDPMNVIAGEIAGNKVYYIDYTMSGEELFSDDRIDNKNGITFVFKESENTFSADSKVDAEYFENDYKITDYSGFRFIYPRVWGVVPYFLDSYAVWTTDAGKYGFPLVAPQVFIYNVSPQARFSYYISLGFDYAKLFPDNYVSFKWKLPGFDLFYSWKSWLGGTRYFIDGSWVDYKVGGIYPFNFANSLSISLPIPFNEYSGVSISAYVNHSFNLYDGYLERAANFFSYGTSFDICYIASTLKASRWDRGIDFNLNMYVAPGILDNTSVRALRGTLSGRAPLGNSSTFFFSNLAGGLEFGFNNYFSVNSSIFKFSENILGNSYSTVSENFFMIDTKAFPMQIFQNTKYGWIYCSLDSGFDISIFKKSYYAHFITLGFKEIYIKTYGEFVYLYNPYNESAVNGLFVDGVFELGLDLFAFYGNITMSHVLGAAVGYNGGRAIPGWSVFYYLSLSL